MKAVALCSLVTRAFMRAAPLAARQIQQRGIATTQRVLSVNNELSQALAREIQAEQQLSQDNLGGTNAPAIPGFNIAQNQAEIRLTKQHGNENILVVFNVSHSVDMDEGGEEEYQQTEAAPVPVALPPFTIEITKGPERLCFHMDLVESHDAPGEYDFRVEEFYVAPAIKEGNEDVPAEVYASSGKYIDPDLHDLLFVRFLEERGFDAQFCKNLVAYATHYEHSQYVGLLNRIKSFVSK